MSSAYSTDRAELCRHTTYRVGCLSCSAHDIGHQLAEAVAETEKLKEAVAGSTALLQSDLSKAELECLRLKLKRATEQHSAWEERAKALKHKADSVKEQVEELCAACEPSQVSSAFEVDAAKREEHLRKIWRTIAPNDTQSEFIQFKQEDPNRTASFKGLDQSNVPATPDRLVSDGAGVQTSSEHGKNIEHQLPIRAIGEHTSPAIMSSGSTLVMSGVPDCPGEDAHSQSEMNVGHSMTEGLAQRDVAATAVGPSEPKTEYDQKRRAAVIDKLKNWKAPKDFHGGSSSHPDPRKYYDHDVTVGALDMEKLGLSPDTFEE